MSALALALGASLLLAFAAAPPALEAAPGWTAPLDTLETVDQPPPWIPQDIQISRKVLPEIGGRPLPLVKAPERPPRLDDPAAAALSFQQARRALAAGDAKKAQVQARAACAADPNRATYAWWRAREALRRFDPEAFDAIPAAFAATGADVVSGKRLLLLGHTALVLWLAVFWTLVVVAYLFRYGGRITHDASALLLRDASHTPRPLAAWALLGALLLLRPGWLVLLAIVSLPLYLHTRGRARVLLVGVWVLTAAALYPGWRPLREALPAADPASETVLLTRSDVLPPAASLIRDLEARLADARGDAARTARLRLALAIQAARGGDYGASGRLFGAIVAGDRTNVAALVGLANTAYFEGRYDAAVRGYQDALRCDPTRGEIAYNLAQAYAKKLFFKESTDALAQANALGFVPAPWEDPAGAANGFSPVVYLSHDREDLQTSARSEAARYPALGHLASWLPWLGGGALPLAWLLTGVLVLAIVLAFWLPESARCEPCANCSAVVCPSCGTLHNADRLCRECGATARRSKSELVLATLLKNRSRDHELAFVASARRLNRIVPGASNLVAGNPLAGLARLVTLAAGLTLLLFGWTFDPTASWDLPGLGLRVEQLHSQLLPLPAHAWSGHAGWSTVTGLVLLLLLYATTWPGHELFRRAKPSRVSKQILKVEGWREGREGRETRYARETADRTAAGGAARTQGR